MTTVDAACDLKVDICRQVIVLMMLCYVLKVKVYLDHGPRAFTIEN